MLTSSWHNFASLLQLLLASFNFFDCSSGDTVGKLDLKNNIKINVENFFEKGKYKNDGSAFFSLRYPITRDKFVTAMAFEPTTT